MIARSSITGLEFSRRTPVSYDHMSEEEGAVSDKEITQEGANTRSAPAPIVCHDNEGTYYLY